MLVSNVIFKRVALTLLSFIMLAHHSVSFAEKPSVGILTGENSVTVEGDGRLNIKHDATIEFWVKPDSKKLDYDPVILSALGENGNVYAIVMSRNLDEVGIFSHDEWRSAVYDFNDGKLHHLAFVFTKRQVDLYIDGKLHKQLEITVSNDDVGLIAIGSIDGVLNPFIGKLAEVRIWQSALNPEDIKNFRLMPIASEEGGKHPSINQLVGVSDFSNGYYQFLLTNPHYKVLKQTNNEN